MIYHKRIPLYGGIMPSQEINRRSADENKAALGGFEDISAEQRIAVDLYRTRDPLGSSGDTKKTTSAQSAVLLFKYGNWLVKHGKRAPDKKKGEDMIRSTMRLCLGK